MLHHRIKPIVADASKPVSNIEYRLLELEAGDRFLSKKTPPFKDNSVQNKLSNRLPLSFSELDLD